MLVTCTTSCLASIRCAALSLLTHAVRSSAGRANISGKRRNKKHPWSKIVCRIKASTFPTPGGRSGSFNLANTATAFSWLGVSIISLAGRPIPTLAHKTKLLYQIAQATPGLPRLENVKYSKKSDGISFIPLSPFGFWSHCSRRIFSRGARG